ncbi:MAG: hypothetical protein PW788_02145 [Micavibrio sp.]|nr:hypothetical protein [Micavibrio sp.]
MAIKYEGKSPNKLWYGWQRTKALVQSFGDYSTGKDAKAAAKNGGMTLGSAVSYGLANSYLLPFIPLPGIGIIASVAASIAVWHFGMNTYRKIKTVNNSNFVYNYVRQKEYAWEAKKARKPLLQRIKLGLKAKADKIPLPLVKAAKWLGIAAAVTGAALATGGALNALGVPAISGSATTATILGGIAKAGALIGLTATAAVGTAIGLAVAAIPVGVAVMVVARNTAIRRNPNRPSFKPKPPAPPTNDDKTPISKGVVFSADKGSSFTFNDNAAPSAQDTPAAEAPGMSEARKAAAAARAARKKGGSRFN